MSSKIPGRILAVDYGMKRTGLALSDEMRIVATPLDAILEEDLDCTVEAVAQLASSHQVTQLVVGMPYLPSGLEGAQCSPTRLFLDSLRRTLPEGFEILEVDERFSTREAEQLLRKTGKKKKQWKDKLDSAAAVVILRQVL